MMRHGLRGRLLRLENGAATLRSVPRPSILVLVLFLARFALANTPPAAPVIVEPSMELQAVNGADVHMVLAQFTDADGDGHRCTDWEIRDVDELVWSAPCAEGPISSHIHLGDGVFSGSHTDASELRAATRFELRVRFRDDSGDPSTEWSAWASRRFQTVVPAPVAPMRLREVLTERPPRWTSGTEDVALPPGAVLELQTVDGDSLFRFGASEIAPAEPRPSAVVIRLRLAAGEGEWLAPESELSFEDGNGQPRAIYLPALSLEARSERFYWLAANGGTHVAAPLDRTPDFSIIARDAPVPWTVERGFRAELFASGFELPVSLVAVPNPGDAPDSPFLYVAELYGTIKVVTRAGEVREFARGLLNFDPRAPIPGNGERGLGGITIDPANGDLIVTAVHQTDPESPWVSPRVLRLESDDGGQTAARIRSIVEFGGDSQAPSHQISNVTFGPDDKLYVHVGSSFSWIAQQLNTTDGKILRMNGDGSAPPDNPFYDSSNGMTATDYIFALGFRNPFGGAWRFADQSLYEVENGPATDRLARVIAGRNYLWDGTDESMRNHAIYNWNIPVAPIQIAFTEPERFDGSGFPSDKLRSAFVTESGPTWATGPQQYGKKISEFVIGPDETLLSGPTTFAEYNGSGKATAAGLVAGPGGLFFTDLYKDYGQSSPVDAGANIIRIRWVGYADFTSRFERSSTISLTDQSDVPDAQSVSWDFGDGTGSSERNPVHHYQESGTYVIRQTITGPRGTVTQARRVFAGGDVEPVRAEYYESEQDPSPAFVQTEHALYFDWSNGSGPPLPEEGFAARFVVGISPRFSEIYRFTVRSHDRVRVMLDGKPLIDAWEPDGSGESSGSIRLVAGRKYELTVQYVRSSETPSLALYWESDSQGSFIVPGSAKMPRRRAVSPP